MRYSPDSRGFDYLLLFYASAIALLGVMTFLAMGDVARQYATRQSVFVVMAVVVIFLLSRLDYRIFKNYTSPSVVFYLTTLLLLVLVLATGEIRGASSWLRFGGFSLEPSELAKISLVILLSKYFSQKHAHIYRVHHVLASGVYAFVPAALTLLQPDLGSTIVFIAIWLAMLLFSGIRKKHLIAILMIGLILASLTWFAALKPYQRSRIESFINPYVDPQGIGYNTIQSQITLGSGRLLGTVISGNDDKLKVRVPEPYTDFTFAAFGQKFGFVGIVILLTLISLLIKRIVTIASAAENNFAKLFGLGYVTIILVHVTINGGMNLGIMPITGIPFPFLSNGGSHMLMLAIGLGIVESIKVRI